MLEKFSAAAIQAINAAREEALRLEFSQVDTDHLLLGLVHERRGVATRCLLRQGVDHRKLRLCVEQLSGRGYSLVRMEDLVFSPSLIRALARAASEQPTLVESQDLFRALLAERDGPATDVFHQLQLDIDALAACLDEIAAQALDAPPGPDEPVLPSRFALRLLTERGRNVLNTAYAATRHFGHTIVGTEQLLHALLAEREGLAAQVLLANEVDPLLVEAVARRVIGRGSGTVQGRLTLSRWSEEVLERAWREARRLGHTRVGSGHILLGLLSLDVGGALYILDHLDVDMAQIRYDVERAFEAESGEAEPAEAYFADGAPLEGLGEEAYAPYAED